MDMKPIRSSTRTISFLYQSVIVGHIVVFPKAWERAQRERGTGIKMQGMRIERGEDELGRVYFPLRTFQPSIETSSPSLLLIVGETFFHCWFSFRRIRIVQKWVLLCCVKSFGNYHQFTLCIPCNIQTPQSKDYPRRIRPNRNCGAEISYWLDPVLQIISLKIALRWSLVLLPIPLLSNV